MNKRAKVAIRKYRDLAFDRRMNELCEDTEEPWDIPEFKQTKKRGKKDGKRKR